MIRCKSCNDPIKDPKPNQEFCDGVCGLAYFNKGKLQRAKKEKYYARKRRNKKTYKKR